MSRELYCNNVPTTLSSAVTTSGQTTFQVTSGLDFPKSGDFRILIGTEICVVTSVVHNSYTPATWTVVRGVEGTTATTYAVDTRIDFIVTSESLARLHGDGRASGNISVVEMGNSKKGDLYIPQDSLYSLVVHDGTKLNYFHTGFKCTPPNFQGWGLREGPDANNVVDSTKRYSLVLDTNSNVSGLHTICLAAPATPYTFTIAMLPHVLSTNYAQAGIGWRSSAGAYATFTTGAYNFTFNNLRVSRWTNYGSINGEYLLTGAFPGWFHGPLVHMRISDDGTNRKCWGSSNGRNWTLIHTVGRTDFLTPSYICLVSGDTSTHIGANVLHLEIA